MELATVYRRRSIIEVMLASLIGLIVTYQLFSCTESNGGTLFLFPDQEETHVDFSNTIAEDDSLNLLVNEYSYMGGGVGIADFNNDGLSDIFLTGNQVSNALFLNKGDFTFENVTGSAGLVSKQWCTGVSIVDINQDGFQDIYVSVAGLVSSAKRRNLLYINQGNLTFKEEASQYGLDFSDFSTQAVFFDYDRDNDLDVFLLNHEVGGDNPNDIHEQKNEVSCISCDRLLRNDGPGNGKKIMFTDVSETANIRSAGLGLGVVSGDFNEDGWADLYIGNDYLASDKLYLNNHDGSFTNVASQSLGHESYSTMGVDAGDINNDGMLDIVSLDMQPENTERKKLMFSFLSYERYEMERRAGYDVQVMRNMLHLNAGNQSNGEPTFNEIGQLAGISETDWSWSALVADFDNDGLKDIHITNGIGRDLIHSDFVQYRSETRNANGMMPIQRQRMLQQKLADMGVIALRNYFFKNEDGLKFRDLSREAGIITNTISNGAAYGDLDNDGDLDLVVNNINGAATLMRNQTDKLRRDEHSITIRFKGKKGNLDGLGARLYVYSMGKVLCADQNPIRGYLSSVDNRLVLGIGKKVIDSVEVIWPDATRQRIGAVPVDTILTFDQADAKSSGPAAPKYPSLFRTIDGGLKISFKHQDPFFNDYSFQRLLPQKYSHEGPCVVTGDVNGDNLTDFFVGGGYRQRGEVFVQKDNGSFQSVPIGVDPKYEEDTGAAFFDVDKDKDLDLFVASGSSEFETGSPYYLPRVYLNDGKGNFKIDKSRIGEIVNTSAKVLAVTDFDQDGDDDIFVGGRIQPLEYPQSPKSFLLRNDNGKLVDVTADVASEIQKAGMVTGAVWMDYDHDEDEDLMVIGEWMTITAFENDHGKFVKAPLENTDMLFGLWRTMSKCDIDRDGDFDLLLGNIGLNHAREMSTTKPWILYNNDFDQNGTREIVLCQYYKDAKGSAVLRPSISRNQFTEQMPSLKKKFPDNESYAAASLEEILGAEYVASATFFKAVESRSGYLENNGSGKFRFIPFPLEAQFAPVNTFVCTDVNSDAVIDVVLAGNEYQREVMQGRDDASCGLVLAGRKEGGFDVINFRRSGLHLKGDIKSMAILDWGRKKEKLLVTAPNQDSLQVMSFR